MIFCPAQVELEWSRRLPFSQSLSVMVFDFEKGSSYLKQLGPSCLGIRGAKDLGTLINHLNGASQDLGRMWRASCESWRLNRWVCFFSLHKETMRNKPTKTQKKVMLLYQQYFDLLILKSVSWMVSCAPRRITSRFFVTVVDTIVILHTDYLDQRSSRSPYFSKCLLRLVWTGGSTRMGSLLLKSL